MSTLSFFVSAGILAGVGIPALAQTSAQDVPADVPIVISASREPVGIAGTPAALTVIGEETIELLDLPQAVDLLRLSPGVSISRSGGAGGQTQVRLRGAEANHTLVFVDGIEGNDPGSSNEFRWEYLPAAGLEQVEILRGPASSLWGSEALGGVVAVTSLQPTADERGFAAGSYGSFDTIDLSAGAAGGSEAAAVSLLGSYYETDGIDSFAGEPKERDGFDNFTLTAKGAVTPAPQGALELVARYSESRSEFDGTDPVTFARADTLDASDNRQVALRGTGRAEFAGGRWTHELTGTFLDTENVNERGDDRLNSVDADSLRLFYETSFSFNTGGAQHRLTGAAELRAQSYRSRDNQYFGASDQDRDRERSSLIGEYRLLSGPVIVAASVRYDDHDTFDDNVSWRAGAKLRAAPWLSLRANAGEAFAAPTFTEQFGFFPDSFVGNADLKPEESFGWDVGAEAEFGQLLVSLTYFEADLENEILTTYDSVTFLSGVDNAAGESERRGIEATASADYGVFGLRASYTYLDADEVQSAGGLPAREVRRPEHSANLTLTADFQPFGLAFSADYVGERRDVDFDSFPSRNVTLDDYVLATLSAEAPVTDRIALTGRVENLFDAEYQDVFGYETSGIAAFAGLTVRFGS